MKWAHALRAIVHLGHRNSIAGLALLLGHKFTAELIRLLGPSPFDEWQVFRSMAFVRLMRRLLLETDPDHLAHLMWTTHYGFRSGRSPISQARQAFKARNGFNAPMWIALSPSSACNYTCPGCWSHKGQSWSSDTWFRILGEVKSLGIPYVIILGGEPFLYPALWEGISQHPDIYFHIYTNGSQLDAPLARRIRELKNVSVLFSIEGFREKTDQRRGPGAFDRALEAQALLREEGVITGFALTVGRSNQDEVLSDAFAEFLLGKGAFSAWYFTYLPVGQVPVANEQLTPDERTHMHARLETLRHRYPVFLCDFMGDHALMRGCLAGGKSYLHVNPAGDIEPCVFIQKSVANIRDHTLEEALLSPYFTAIREGGRSACWMLDRQEELARMTHAHGTEGTIDH